MQGIPQGQPHTPLPPPDQPPSRPQAAAGAPSPDSGRKRVRAARCRPRGRPVVSPRLAATRAPLPAEFGRRRLPVSRDGPLPPGVLRFAFPVPERFEAGTFRTPRRERGGREKTGRDVSPPRRLLGDAVAQVLFLSAIASPARPCTGRASAPRRRRTRAAGSGALPPVGAPCRPPRGATGALITRRPTATGPGLTAAATRREATASTAAAGGSRAPRRGGRPRAGRRASAPGTRLPTAANPRLELSCTRSSTSALPGASRGTTRDHPGHLLHLVQRMAERKECLMMWKTITDLQCLRTHGLA